jgi:predicted nucleotidyltransferase
MDVLDPRWGIEYAFVYGSFANHTETGNSDIDLFIIGSVGLRKLSAPLRKLSQTLNREINPSTYSKSSYLSKLKDGDAFILEVTTSRKIWIVGSADEFAKLA